MDAISEVQYYFDFLEKPIGKLTLLDAYRISIKSTDEETTYLSYQSKDLDKINNLKDEILEGIKKKTHEYKMLQQLSMVV